MIKKIIYITILFSAGLIAQPKFSEYQSMTGSFSRIGFGARGIGMGNAMSAVTEGELVSYYNPAVSAFQDNNSFQTSYTFLSLDRSANFLNFTRRFDFYSQGEGGERRVRSSAGISAGVINAGVSNIEKRDNQGLKTGDISTSENQFFVGLANRFSERFSAGIAIKFYHYSLYEDISSNALGIDLGLLYKISDNVNISGVITDINSKYEWDTGPLYGAQSGARTVDKFPIMRKLGISFVSSDRKIVAAAEFENSSVGSNIIRIGGEYNIFDRLVIRGGLDRLNISNTDNPVKPAAGFSYSRYAGSVLIGINYAFMLEQFSPSDRHIVGINVNF
jgi:hypothetical protein